MSNTPARPWLIRTYAGHSTAKDSNALYRTNLSKGQTGLSVAFDLPTQTGYDSEGKVVGDFVATGLIPDFYEQLSKRGINVNLGIFESGTVL